jgi:DNA-binding transcriptional MerR regulator
VQKSADAFRTISEVAEELDVPQHVLRFWESKFTQIKPLKRAGGRRYYRPDDVNLLRGIRSLLYSDGYTIKGVQKVLKERGARFVSGGGAVSTPATENVVVVEAAPAPAPASKAAVRRRSAEPDPDEMPLPFFMPDFLKTPAAAAPTKPAKAPDAPLIAPAQRKKLEKVLAELTAIKGLLAGD